jgi:hypothetical protein
VIVRLAISVAVVSVAWVSGLMVAVLGTVIVLMDTSVILANVAWVNGQTVVVLGIAIAMKVMNVKAGSVR